MKTDYIVLRAKQPNTRDLFSGAAASWASAYAAARAMPLGDPFGQLYANAMAAAPGAGATLIRPPVFQPMAVPAFVPAAVQPELSVEVRSLDRSRAADLSKMADVVASAPSIPTVLLKEMHDTAAPPSRRWRSSRWPGASGQWGPIPRASPARASSWRYSILGSIAIILRSRA